MKGEVLMFLENNCQGLKPTRQKEEGQEEGAVEDSTFYSK